MAPPRRTDRDENIKAMYAAGMTLEKIGQRYGVTRERIRQILKKYGITSQDGGARKLAEIKNEKKAAARDSRYRAKHGIDFATYSEIKRAGGVIAYRTQKANAYKRDIPFRISLADFWRIWQESGKWAERGRGKGKYCLARYNDSGAYEVGNVWVCSFSENCREARSRSKRGNGNVHFINPGTRKPWLAKHGNVCIGFFKTREEAVSAKREYVEKNVGLVRVAKGYTIERRNRKRPYYVQASRNGQKFTAYYATEEEARAAYLNFIGAGSASQEAA